MIILKNAAFINLITVLMLLFSACGESSNEGTDESISEVEISTEDSDIENRSGSARNIFYMIPSPIETVSLLKKAGAEYHGDILNDPQSSSRYETARKQAVNLGIYGADLSYSSLFDQTQESTFFVTSCKKLAEGLGIMNAFDEQTLARIEDNINDRDSMLYIISDAYWVVNAYLKEEQKENTSALIIVGGWLEGLHIAIHVANHNPDNEGVLTRIAEQKYCINNLVALVGTYDMDADIEYVSNDLNELKEIYDQLEVVKTKGENTQDENGITIIGGTKEIKMSDEQLAAISEKVNSIRNKYIE